MRSWIGDRYRREEGVVPFTLGWRWRYDYNHFKIGTMALTAMAAYYVARDTPLRIRILSYALTPFNAGCLAFSISLVAQCIYIELNRWYEEYGRHPSAGWFQRHVYTSIILSYMTSSAIHYGILALAKKITHVASGVDLPGDLIAITAVALLIKMVSRITLPTVLVGREERLPYGNRDSDGLSIHRHRLAKLGIPGLNFFG